MIGGDTVLLAIHGAVVGSLVILGVIFLKGKGAFLIAGYNTASKAEKEKIDEKKLCRCMSKMMFALAGCFFIVMLSDIFHKMWILWLGLGLVFIVSIGGMVYINTGDRIKK